MGRTMDAFGEVYLYHGSDHIVKVEDIKFPGPRDDCDFGRGFYLTANKQVAEEWVFEESTPVINVYRVKTPLTSVLELSDEDWLRIVVGFRSRSVKVRFTSPYVYGWIADDRMDDSLAMFLNERMGDIRLFQSLLACNLGKQYCFRTTAECLDFQSSTYELKGLQLQQAADRFFKKRNDMHAALKKIHRTPVNGEQFVEDYIARGDYVEN